MQKKIIVSTIVFFNIVIIATLSTALNIESIRFAQTVFEVQKNDELSLEPKDYIRASEGVLADVTLNFDNVNTGSIGTYIAYAYYKTKTYEFKIRIVDNQPPEIVPKELTITVYLGEKIKAIDLVNVTDDSNYIAYFSDVKNAATNVSIDIGTLGTREEITFTTAATYFVSLKAEDEYGNEPSGSVKVKIIIEKDNIDPEIFGIGDELINLGSNFDRLLGVSAKDNIDGDITDKLIVTGEVNTSKSGIYDVTYEISDSHNNPVKKIRRIIVSNLDIRNPGELRDIDNGDPMTLSEFNEMLESIGNVYNEIGSYEVPNRVSYINAFLCQTITDIDIANVGGTRSYDVIVKREANSRQAVARAFKMMCDYLDIECYIVNGTGYISSWYWNIVEIDGKYYHIDVYMNKLNKRDKSIFLLSDYSMTNEGYTWNKSRYPKCSSDYE